MHPSVVSYQPHFAYRQLGTAIILVAFPLALLVFAFSGFDVRHRSAKAGCRAGSVEQCLAVAKIYDAASLGLVGFLLSNVETARTYYDRACSLGSSAACDRLGTTILHGADAAADSKFSAADAARAFEKACASHLPDACYAVGVLYVEGHGVSADEARAARVFSEACAGGNSAACNQLGLFHAHGRGGFKPDPTLALQFFSQSCDADGGPSEACAAVFTFKKTGRFP